MQSIVFIAAVLLPGLKPLAKCPRPVLININLNHFIDRGVFKRTFFRCRRQYKKSPCLVKLVQPEKGAFHAICGETQTNLTVGLSPDAKLDEMPIEAILELNCSADIFASYLASDWSNYQTYPIVGKTQVNFCGALQ